MYYNYNSNIISPSPRLVELTAQREAAASTAATRPANVEGGAGLRVLMRNFGDENLVSEPLIYMPTMVSDGVEVSRILIMITQILVPGETG